MLVAAVVCVSWAKEARGQGTDEIPAPPTDPAVGAPAEPPPGDGTGEVAPGAVPPDGTQPGTPADAEVSSSLTRKEARPEPVAPDHSNPVDAEEAAAADERIAALEERVAGLESALYETTAEDRQLLRIYGFADAGFRFFRLLDGCTDTSLCLEQGKTPSRFRNVIDEHPTFVLGNLNLYVDAEPVPSFRLLTEVRLSRYPQGVESGLDFERQDNSVYDVTSSTGRNRVVWSGIILERAQMEWSRYDAVRVIAGYFLTPYGIWNVDHGTPTLISLALPNFFALEYIPTHLTGVQLLGRTGVGAVDIGYHAYVANGRNSGVLDNNPAKGWGGRAFLELQEGPNLVAGVSGYYERVVERQKEVIEFEPFTVDSDRVVDYRDWSIAADLSLDVGQTRFRGEWVLNRVEYQDGYRASPVPTRYAPDRWRQNFYLLVAHEIGRTHFEPYIYGEYNRGANVTDRASSISSVGLNYSFNPFTKLKTQFFYTRFYPFDEPDAPEVRQNDFLAFDTRFVMAF